jgi:hypothetical protein
MFLSIVDTQQLQTLDVDNGCGGAPLAHPIRHLSLSASLAAEFRFCAGRYIPIVQRHAALSAKHILLYRRNKCLSIVETDLVLSSKRTETLIGT